MSGVAVYLPMEDWNKVLAVLAQAPWNVVNPLIMAMGEQLRSSQAAAAGPGLHNDGVMNQAGRPNEADPNP